MDGTHILRDQLTWAHNTIEQAVDGLSPDELHHQMPGATIQSIAHIYAHVVLSEDWLIRRFVTNEPTLFEKDGWDKKTGILPFTDRGPSPDWAASVRDCDFSALREYAQVVYAATDAYLASLTPADLDRTVTFGRLGEMPLGRFLSQIVAYHTGLHGGEVCALKGVLGHKGLPY